LVFAILWISYIKVLNQVLKFIQQKFLIHKFQKVYWGKKIGKRRSLAGLFKKSFCIILLSETFSLIMPDPSFKTAVKSVCCSLKKRCLLFRFLSAFCLRLGYVQFSKSRKVIFSWFMYWILWNLRPMDFSVLPVETKVLEQLSKNWWSWSTLLADSTTCTCLGTKQWISRQLVFWEKDQTLFIVTQAEI
jgi:hypothetical protein